MFTVDVKQQIKKSNLALFACKFHHESLICLPIKKFKSKLGNTRASIMCWNLMKYLWPLTVPGLQNFGIRCLKFLKYTCRFNCKKSTQFHWINGELSLLPDTIEIQSGIITHWSKLVKTSKIINYSLLFKWVCTPCLRKSILRQHGYII